MEEMGRMLTKKKLKTVCLPHVKLILKGHMSNLLNNTAKKNPDLFMKTFLKISNFFNLENRYPLEYLCIMNKSAWQKQSANKKVANVLSN